MRKWASLAVILAALIGADAAVADTPASVYSDFAEDGVLSCSHSRSALKGVLNDATIYQYGDPLTLLGLKLAIRRQLAGGCQPKRATAFFGSTPPGSARDAGVTRNSSRRNSKAQPKEAKGSLRERREPRERATVDTQGTTEDGRMAILGVALLLLTLGSGGWAARRAFADPQ